MKINGVLGPIDTKDLGNTLIHEHMINLDPAMMLSFSDWYDRRALTKRAIKEVLKAKKAGVKTIVEASPANLWKDITTIREIAENTGVNFIVSTGLYWQEAPWYLPQFMDVPYMVKTIKREITQGIQGTNIKANVIKCATDCYGLSDVNKKFLQMAAQLHKETGKPIYTHASINNKAGQLQQEFFDAEGIDISKIVIGHASDSNDLDYLETLLKNGSYLGFDRVGRVLRNSVENIADNLAELCKRGWSKKIMLSHDASVRTDFGRSGCKVDVDRDAACGPFDIVATKLIPMLLKAGVSQDDIDHMTINNVRRYFEGNA